MALRNYAQVPPISQPSQFSDIPPEMQAAVPASNQDSMPWEASARIGAPKESEFYPAEAHADVRLNPRPDSHNIPVPAYLDAHGNPGLPQQFNAQSPLAAHQEPSPALPVMSPGSLEAMGFAGFKLDFTSFPTISLKNEGRFEDTDGHLYGTSFDCYLMSSRERFVYRAITGSEVEDNRKDTGFTYDHKTFTNGTPVAQQVALWESQGKSVEIRDYLEIQCILHGGDMGGEWRLLSIPRLSVGRFWGFFSQLSHLTASKPSSVPVRVSVGEKVLKARQPWYPWAFSLIRIS